MDVIATLQDVINTASIIKSVNADTYMAYRDFLEGAITKFNDLMINNKDLLLENSALAFQAKQILEEAKQILTDFAKKGYIPPQMPILQFTQADYEKIEQKKQKETETIKADLNWVEGTRFSPLKGFIEQLTGIKRGQSEEQWNVYLKRMTNFSAELNKYLSVFNRGAAMLIKYNAPEYQKSYNTFSEDYNRARLAFRDFADYIAIALLQLRIRPTAVQDYDNFKRVAKDLRNLQIVEMYDSRVYAA